MNPLVDVEVGALAEALPTPAALVGPLPSVHSLMNEELGALTEALPTLATEVGLLPGVHPEVDSQV